MKMFTIQCNFGGKNLPQNIYVGEPKEGNHPLQNQAEWLSKERGGTIPPEVMESFSKLLKLAKERGVPFDELCDHALRASSAKAKKKLAEGKKSTPESTSPAL